MTPPKRRGRTGSRPPGSNDPGSQPPLPPLLPPGLLAVLIGLFLEIPFRQMIRNLHSKPLLSLSLYPDQNRTYRLLPLLPPCLCHAQSWLGRFLDGSSKYQGRVVRTSNSHTHFRNVQSFAGLLRLGVGAINKALSRGLRSAVSSAEASDTAAFPQRTVNVVCHRRHSPTQAVPLATPGRPGHGKMDARSIALAT